MTRAWLLTCAIYAGLPCVATSAEDEISAIAVPIRLRLGDIAAYANEPGRLPLVLHHREVPQTCVEPEQACTKVPEFRGLKVTFKNRCIEVSPRIECMVTEDVRRAGPMRISGEGGTIRITQDILGSGTVTGRGEIGRHIRQTVQARAEFTIEGRPALGPDWTPMMPVSLSYRWTDPPEFRLFNLFPVTVRSSVEPPLNDALRTYEQETLPSEISKLNVRGEAERLWRALQNPHPVDLESEQLFLHITPLAVGLEGPHFDGGALTARLTISARLRLDRDRDPPGSPKPLPNLMPAPASGYQVVLPVTMELRMLAAQVALPAEFQIDGPIPARVKVTSLRLASGTNGRLQAILAIDARPAGVVSGAPGFRGAVTVVARPILDQTNGLVRFEEPELALGTPEEPNRILELAIGSGLLGQWLVSELAFDTGPQIRRAESALNSILNRDIAPGLRLAGQGKVELYGLSFKDPTVTLLVRSTGEIRVEGFDPTSR